MRFELKQVAGFDLQVAEHVRQREIARPIGVTSEACCPLIGLVLSKAVKGRRL